MSGLRQKHSLFLGILSAGPLTAPWPPQGRFIENAACREEMYTLNDVVRHPGSSLARNSFIAGYFLMLKLVWVGLSYSSQLAASLQLGAKMDGAHRCL